MPPQYIFPIEKLSKAYGKKEVLKNIWLSFYPGAKIGVIGGQRVGQEHAAEDHGRARHRTSVGTGDAGARDLHRLRAPGADARPDARRPRQRRAGRRDDAQPPCPVRRDQCPAGRGARRRRDGRLLEEQASVQDAIEAASGWDLDRASRSPWTPCGCRPATPMSARSPAASVAELRFARSCSNAPTSSCSTSPPTTSTPRASPGSNATWRSTRGPSCSSPTTAISSTTWPSGFSSSTAGQGIPWEGNYSSWLEQKQARLALEEKQESNRRKQLARELEWVRMSPLRPGGQEPCPAPALRAACQPGSRQARRGHRPPDPAWPPSGHARRRGRGVWPRATVTGSCSKA